MEEFNLKMLARKDFLAETRQCRFCLSQDEPLRNLYDKNQEKKKVIPLSLKILTCISVEIFPSDKMPCFICNRCRYFIELFYKYKQICRQADESILQYIQHETALEPIVWQPNLVKMYRNGVKSFTDVSIMKTVVEGGASVEVSQEMSDSEDGEGDGNVYKVKIEGAEESSACIKVVTDDKGPKKKAKGHIDKEDATHRKSSLVVNEGCWPCDECDCTYSLQQLLELHKKQKHRARTAECNQCHAKFFSKYDLETHKQSHSKDTPFQCFVCGKSFKRLVLLKRHEKLVHSDMPQLQCKYCPATFLCAGDLEEHNLKHPQGDRSYTCDQCDKRFLDKKYLQKHRDVVHNMKPKFSCQYCPELCSSMSKLQKHVRAHAGERAYPCKYCDKSFVKSHHYTRHLRVKHSEVENNTPESTCTEEQYRCDQCEDTFMTEDDLIYHSAIHATQNLICPLCQEKFENVESVTAHIKSHVNGEEFMCDYCELVFTTKDKLETHTMIAHSEEEIEANESSMDMDAEDDDDDNTMNLTEVDGQMVVEINKPSEFLVKTPSVDEAVADNSQSEESEAETTYLELSTVDTMAEIHKIAPKQVLGNVPMVLKQDFSFGKSQTPIVAAKAATHAVENRSPTKKIIQTVNIFQKIEDYKSKAVQEPKPEIPKAEPPKPEAKFEAVPEKKVEKPVSKVESSASTGASDKSLRLLEKELQELKRTTTRNDVAKTPAKSTESLRSSNRRPQLYSSTPKPSKTIEERRSQTPKTTNEKKGPERRAVKENKEPKEKETKEVKVTKEDKEKESKNNISKDDKEKDSKENNTAKCSSEKPAETKQNDKNGPEDNVRRSTRPSKVKDYAKMVRDGSQADTDNSDEDEEYTETEKSFESRSKLRKSAQKASQKSTPTGTKQTPSLPKKRGRPRKDPFCPSKQKKEDSDEEPETKREKTPESTHTVQEKESTPTPAPDKSITEDVNANENLDTPENKPNNLIVSPSGQTLKKVTIKALPPGVRPLPLPMKARGLGNPELCEMQIGQKVVKVQKIVMTKAEVEAMAKKGLVEMKDGTMVLKQGIKLPTSDVSSFKSLVSEDSEKRKESPIKKPAPTRCEMEE